MVVHQFHASFSRYALSGRRLTALKAEFRRRTTIPSSLYHSHFLTPSSVPFSHTSVSSIPSLLCNSHSPYTSVSPIPFSPTYILPPQSIHLPISPPPHFPPVPLRPPNSRTSIPAPAASEADCRAAKAEISTCRTRGTDISRRWPLNVRLFGEISRDDEFREGEGEGEEE